MESPRQCVFVGTVNHCTYLRDETGGRRFGRWFVGGSTWRVWPVCPGLWAEAKTRFESGSFWWLDTPDLVQLASDQQEARYECDPSEEVIGPWLASRQTTAISEVVEKCLNKPQAQWTLTDKIRAARCLRARG